jgi:hypothetical protein
MMRQHIHFTYDDKKSKQPGVYIPAIKHRISYTYVPQSVSDLCHAIEKPDVFRPDGNPEITTKTVRRRLKDMVKGHVLVKLTKEVERRRRWEQYRLTGKPYRNETFYRLHTYQLYYYLDYLLTLLTCGMLSTAEKDSLLLKLLGLPCKPHLVYIEEEEVLEMMRKRLPKHTPRIYMEDIRKAKR